MGEKSIRISVEQVDDDDGSGAGSDINGTVHLNYRDRFDGVQVNTYVTGAANEQLHFVSMDGKTISILARLYVSRNEIGEKEAFRFTARLDRKKEELPKGTKIRLRAAIIQEHKEVESDTILVPVPTS
ncbi:MAG: hypothetical protein ACE5JV_00385 [Nitrososphaerales archaeon]